MRRREFVTLASGAAVAWPVAARAQQAAMPVIGFLDSRSPGTNSNRVAAFRKGLSETGFCKSSKVRITCARDMVPNSYTLP
jgi:hypothetical protein